MPTRPWSQPGITMPAPSLNLNGSLPRLHDESNSCPVLHETPTYCIDSVSPDSATLPLPWTTSRTWSEAGGLPFGFGITGLTLMSDACGGSVTPWTACAPPPPLSCFWLPQPASASAATATTDMTL